MSFAKFMKFTSLTKIVYVYDIMNHGSGFIIEIARKNCENPNKTFTKINFESTLIAFIY